MGNKSNVALRLCERPSEDTLTNGIVVQLCSREEGALPEFIVHTHGPAASRLDAVFVANTIAGRIHSCCLCYNAACHSHSTASRFQQCPENATCCVHTAADPSCTATSTDPTLGSQVSAHSHNANLCRPACYRYFS